MRRSWFLFSLAAVVLLGTLAVAGLRPTAAQDATPGAEEDFGLEGLTFEPIGFGAANRLPAAPADLVLIRLTIEPAAYLPFDPEDASVALVAVESGTVTVRADVPLQVLRAATLAMFATPGAVEEDAVPAPEDVAADTEFTLEAGDSVVFPPNVGGEARNEGSEPAVLLAAIVEAQPGDADGAPAGTPAP